jgi:hemerythrin-like metal-binding protein
MNDTATATRNANIEWGAALELELAFMDDTHQEFIDLLVKTQTAADADLLDCFDAMVQHTVEHFGAEDRWMRDTQFSSSNCHTLQHNVVLQVMQEGLRRGRDHNDLPLLREMAHELGIWFPQHAQSMDAALALHLRRVAYDEATGEVRNPDELPKGEIHGCGGSSCS